MHLKWFFSFKIYKFFSLPTLDDLRIGELFFWVCFCVLTVQWIFFTGLKDLHAASTTTTNQGRGIWEHVLGPTLGWISGLILFFSILFFIAYVSNFVIRKKSSFFLLLYI